MVHSVTKGRWLGRFFGFGIGLTLLAFGALLLLAKPLALLALDAVVLERLRDDLSLSVEAPKDVHVGEVCTLTIMIHNEEEHPIRRMLYVDLREGLYDAFEPVRSQPAWVYCLNDEVRRHHKLAYEVDIPPGSTTYMLQLRAAEAGRWKGDINYYRTTSRRPVGPPIPISIHISDAPRR